MNRVFDAKVTIRGTLHTLTSINALLGQSFNERCRTMFCSTVFGKWLDFPEYSNENLLLNYIFQHEVKQVQNNDVCPPIRYKIGNNHFEFGRQEFCLITGFAFGKIPKAYTFYGLQNSPFCDRVFPDKISKPLKKVRVLELLGLIKSPKKWYALSDEDSVKVCLLLVSNIVFMGREPKNYIVDNLIELVDDLTACDANPRGEYFFESFIPKEYTGFDFDNTENDSLSDMVKTGEEEIHLDGLEIVDDPFVQTLVKQNLEEEEIENFLNDDSIPIGVEDSPFNMEEDILFLEGLLIEDPFPSHPIIPNQTKSLVEKPKHSFRMGYEHFSTTLVTNDVAESSTKNLIPIPRECEVISDNGSESTEPVKDESLVFTTFSNPLLDNDKINFDELNSHVESNSVESTSNHDTVKFDNLDEFSRPFIPIHIVEEERIMREHADYINRMEMLFTINPHPRSSTYANTNVESFSSLPIPIQDSDPQPEAIDDVTETDDVLHPGVENDDSDREVDVVDGLRVDNSI
nr:phospholipase-like protein [Tanacetum cinerariifolium]